MARIVINERKLASLANQARRWPASRRKIISDATVPGAAARIHGKTGQISLGMVARFPLHPENPTFRKWGDYAGAASLKPWRDGMREWIRLMHEQHTDPRVDQARRQAAALRQQDSSFAAMWSAYYEQQGCHLAKAAEAQRAGEVFVKTWGIRPAGEIEPVEIAAHIRPIAKRTPAEARNRLGHLSRAYSWAIGSGGFGLTVNPCKALRPKDLVGAKIMRDRVLTDVEIAAVWRAADGVADASALAEARRRDGQRDPKAPLAYPYGPLIKLLILTGQRVNEVATLLRSDIDFDKKLITIAASRMKGGRAHEVPLAPMALDLLRSLPRFTGPFVFTTGDGSKPVNGFSKTKERLDALSGVRSWVLHDLRRSVRTHFSALPVQDMVRELVIAHARPGLHAVYDQHSYFSEKAECLRLWEMRLRAILYPSPPASITDIVQVRQRRAGA
jgi:integrase